MPATGKTTITRALARETGDIADLPLPTWSAIRLREYEPWDTDRLVLDTARCGVVEAAAQVRSALQA